ncbi:hypothetical protein [Aquicoccus sp.]|uniref:hypothetical protein n=1 Tax=Aquicoccus sp. TaxID=2055851 RepID=UPI0035626EE7
MLGKYSLWFLAGTVVGLVRGGNSLLAQMGEGEAQTSYAITQLVLAALPYTGLALLICFVLRRITGHGRTSA